MRLMIMRGGAAVRRQAVAPRLPASPVLSAAVSGAEGLDSHAARLLRVATKLKTYAELSANTKRAYSEAFRRFCAHCAALARPALPIDPELVADWLESQALAGAPISTLDVARLALDHTALRGGGEPPSRSPLVRAALERARRVARLPENRDRRRTHRVVVQVSAGELEQLRAEAAAGRYSVPGFIRARLLGSNRARRLPPSAAPKTPVSGKCDRGDRRRAVPGG